jgi:hypothetical protein
MSSGAARMEGVAETRRLVDNMRREGFMIESELVESWFWC